MIDLCDGLIIPGGSFWYDYDVFVTSYAIKKDIPILGICLGMQLIASIKNNEYSLERNNTIIDHKKSDKKYVHDIKIKNNTKLKNILKTNNIKVNSRHESHIKKSNNYIISAYSNDGIIEAIELKENRFVVGVQWHPEDMITYDESSKRIFKEFFNQINNII